MLVTSFQHKAVEGGTFTPYFDNKVGNNPGMDDVIALTQIWDEPLNV
jgi:hypothetical protein